MSEDENFVARWSRLKREKAQERRDLDAPSSDVRQAPAADRSITANGTPEEVAAFDVSQLPSIDSLTASSDIKAFLQSGVPAELTKAALRKVWTTDPAIRDFIGIAENQWDFTDPTTIPGFGPLNDGDDIAKLVAQAMGKLEPKTQPDAGMVADATAGNSTVGQGSPGVSAATESSTSATADLEREEKPLQELAAVQHSEPPIKIEPITNRRPHGRALPR
jgi:hypothetical protein